MMKKWEKTKVLSSEHFRIPITSTFPIVLRKIQEKALPVAQALSLLNITFIEQTEARWLSNKRPIREKKMSLLRELNRRVHTLGKAEARE